MSQRNLVVCVKSPVVPSSNLLEKGKRSNKGICPLVYFYTNRLRSIQESLYTESFIEKAQSRDISKHGSYDMS